MNAPEVVFLDQLRSILCHRSLTHLKLFGGVTSVYNIPDLTNKMLSRAEQSITLENSSSPDPEGQARLSGGLCNIGPQADTTFMFSRRVLLEPS